EWRNFEPAQPLTVAFLVYAQHAWPGGPAFLAAFGMDPMATLSWSWQLATRLPHLLCSTPFAMAEMKIASSKEPPSRMSFTDAWEVDPLGVPEPTRGQGATPAAARRETRAAATSDSPRRLTTAEMCHSTRAS